MGRWQVTSPPEPRLLLPLSIGLPPPTADPGALGIATRPPAAGAGGRQLSSPRPSAARCHSFPSLKYVFYYKLLLLMNNIPTALRV